MGRQVLNNFEMLLLRNFDMKKRSPEYCCKIRLCPMQIRFMHDSISKTFRNGRSVNETIFRIWKGKLKVETLPKIKVIHKNGFYYTLNNRRLYVFRVLFFLNFLPMVNVNLVSNKRFQKRKFTTLDNGKTIFLNDDQTLFHYREKENEKYQKRNKINKIVWNEKRQNCSHHINSFNFELCTHYRRSVHSNHRTRNYNYREEWKSCFLFEENECEDEEEDNFPFFSDDEDFFENDDYYLFDDNSSCYSDNSDDELVDYDIYSNVELLL